MTDITEAGTIRVLATIKAGHPPMETGNAAIKFWMMALRMGRVTNVNDAIAAVVAHYSTPGANPWIIPGDVIGHYRAIQQARTDGINDGDLTPDLDPFAPERVYVEAVQARYEAVKGGLSVEQAIATVPLPKAIEARS